MLIATTRMSHAQYPQCLWASAGPDSHLPQLQAIEWRLPSEELPHCAGTHASAVRTDMRVSSAAAIIAMLAYASRRAQGSNSLAPVRQQKIYVMMLGEHALSMPKE